MFYRGVAIDVRRLVGPLFWNDATYSVNRCNLSICADDHQLDSSGKTVTDVEASLYTEESGGSFGWASGCHAEGREFDSGRTNTQGL